MNKEKLVVVTLAALTSVAFWGMIFTQHAIGVWVFSFLAGLSASMHPKRGEQALVATFSGGVFLLAWAVDTCTHGGPVVAFGISSIVHTLLAGLVVWVNAWGEAPEETYPESLNLGGV